MKLRFVTVNKNYLDQFCKIRTTRKLSKAFIATAPVVDLDGNDSSGATDGDYDVAYTEGGPAVSVADVDIAISDADDTTLSSATSVRR